MGGSDQRRKGALAAVAAGALVVGVAAGVVVWRRRSARRASSVVTVAPVSPVERPIDVGPPAASSRRRRWTAAVRTNRAQRLLAKIAAAVIVVTAAAILPIHHPAPDQARVALSTGVVRSLPVVGTATPTAPPSEQAPHCRSTLIGTARVDRVVARTAPSMAAPPVASFTRVNPQGAVQVFDLGRWTTDRADRTWYRALLPMRPNGTRGWIQASSLELSRTDYRIVVDQRRFQLRLFRQCRRVRTLPIGLGKDSTPTPVGRFYIVSLMRPTVRHSVYGRWAYGLSAYSDAIRDWTWGGVIGIHGTNDPSSIGRAVSHGCVRMRNADMDRLVTLLPLGTPVRIEPA
ncbi:MAG TPA: L,D-transpeptidase [Actinomycetota bacterium]|nr:L,D-transpeptidase [Actinomycetota bacterium]